MTGSSCTIHVALTDGAQVWVEPDGTLPSFVHEPAASGPTATATASRLLTDAVHLVPAIVLDDADSRLHVLAARGAPPARGHWTDLDDLPADVGSHVARSIREHWGALPPRRPDWYRPGWHVEVETWIDGALASSGRSRTGSLRTHRVWSISAVHVVPTDRGPAWFKASCDHFAAEAAIVATLAAHLPELVPQVLAVERDRGWLLTEPLSGAGDDRALTDVASALTPRWAAAQVDTLGWLDDLRRAGAPDRGPTATLAAWRQALRTSPELDDLTPDERAALSTAIPIVETRVRELWACGFPDTLGHGDLHAGNIAHDGASVRIFDWSDGCITHPFLDGAHLAHWLADGYADGDRAAAQVREVLTPWRETHPGADFDRAVELAPLADLVFQTVTFDRLARGIEAGTGDFDGVVAMLTRKVVEWVTAEDD